MAWCANAVESQVVSAINFNGQNAGDPLSFEAESGKFYWETEATEISSTIKAKEDASDKYLAVDETVPLYRTMNGHDANTDAAPGTSLAENGVYFKSDVQFTASDETSGKGMVAEGDKLLVWLRATEAVEADPENNIEGQSATTNLIITAMNADGTDSADYVIATTGEGGINIDPATWYTLTIKAKQTGGVGEETAEFEVYVREAGSETDTKLASGQKTSFTSLVAAGGKTSTTITSVGFKGTGALDNLEFGTFTEQVVTFDMELSINAEAGVWPEGQSQADSVLVGDAAYEGAITYTHGQVGNVDIIVAVDQSKSVTSSKGTFTYDSERGGYVMTLNLSDQLVDLVVDIAVTNGGTPTYDVTISGGANATVTTDPATITGLANGATVTITATPNQGYTYTGVDYTGWTLSGTAITKTVTIASENVAVVVPAAVSASPSTEFPSTWNNSKEPSAEILGKYATWAKDNDPTDEGAEDAFLLGIASDAADKTLAVNTIVVEGGKVKITSNRNLKDVNGVPYILTGDAPNAVNHPAAAKLDNDGNIEYQPEDTETKKFYKIGVGYAVPDAQ